jgi:hypothetical protein
VILLAGLTRPFGVDCTSQQGRLGIPPAGDIPNHPLPRHKVAIACVIVTELYVEGNFVQVVPPAAKLVAVTAFENGVGFAVVIHATTGLWHPV